MYFILYSTSIVFATRYCLDGRVWSPIQFSGCTLVSGGVAPFELMTMKLLNATTTNAVQNMETQIASEVNYLTDFTFSLFFIICSCACI